MTKKRTVTLAVSAVLLFCVIAAGCSGPTASPTPSTAHNSTKIISSRATSSVQAVATATPTPTPSTTPTPSSSPSLGASGVTVRYFYEVGCPVCANFTWRVNQLESTLNAKYPGKVSIVRISNPDSYGVNTVPTLALLNNGVEVGRWVNPADTTAISSQIDSLLYGG